ncbi:Transposon Ty3-I Gag-Pol polyprotein [Fusarium oxysporum f. sp. albedinis]|nr:Transposon Ty3-I Gag-Pol polyprotein [Fusarium oxysporum f. sp. albedinis]
MTQEYPYKSLHYDRPYRIHHSADHPVALTFLDHHFSIIQPLPAYQHLSDQLLAMPSIQSLSLLSVKDELDYYLFLQIR